MADETTTTPEETPASETPTPDAPETEAPTDTTAEAPATPEFDPAELLTKGLGDLLEIAEPAQEFEGALGTYKLTPLNAWTVRQNLAAREIYKRAIKKIRDGRTEGKKIDFIAVVDSLLDDEALWCDLFSLLYIPSDEARYKVERAKEYREDMLEMTNQQAIGALAFFITSSLSFIPRDILGFFREMNVPMVTAVINVLERPR